MSTCPYLTLKSDKLNISVKNNPGQQSATWKLGPVRIEPVLILLLFAQKIKKDDKFRQSDLVYLWQVIWFSALQLGPQKPVGVRT